MWFTELGANRIGVITPDGRVSEFPVNRPARKIVAGPDGNLWFTSDGFLSRMTPAGVVTDFPLTGSAWGITVGADRNVWFTELAKVPGPNYFGRATAEGQIAKLPIQANASDITSGPDGNFWVPDWTELAYDAIVSITPSGVETRWPLSGRSDVPGDAGPTAVAVASDGSIWFTETTVSKLGRIAQSAVTEFAVPGYPLSIATGSDGNVWFAEAIGNSIGRITPFGVITEFPIPTPGAQPSGISAGADGNIWFTERGAGRIGRISGVTCDTTTLCLAGNRFHVSLNWTSPSSSGRGLSVPLTPASGYFWLFDPADVEVVVKIVDGCSFNARKWVFAAGLTNVNVVLTVTDTQTGLSKTYVNPQGTAFLPIQDTDAFSCP